MGSTSSHTGNPSITKDREPSHISIQLSKLAQTKFPRMALAFHSQVHHQDDLGHDTLMGLQELDSHLTVFEETVPPINISDSSSDDFQDATDMTSSNHSHEKETNNFNTKVEISTTPRNVIEANGNSMYASPVIKCLTY